MQPAVLFDLDGLLIDSEPIWEAAKSEVFGAFGLHLTQEMQTETRGMRQRDMVAYWFKRANIQADPADIEDKIVNGVCDMLRDVKLMPGAEQAVAACARVSKSMAVVSSSPESVIRQALESTRLAQSFDVVFSAEDDEFGKPHPGAFLRAATTLQIPPDECVVLEDSLNGVLAGVSAQMAVIAVPDEDNRGDPRFAIASLILDSLEELDPGDIGHVLSTPTRAR
ncbi:HAD family hydrolase [Cumulibacter soli]|uniref:HAD family hydrolase n=1 Tax=Cumulibacter soli TaxID=2546344 RepID=UPI0010686783|nr:HAD-IA family hydrolase [Cumulibacter soli]